MASPLLFTNCQVLDPLLDAPVRRNLLVVGGKIADEKEYFYDKKQTRHPTTVDCSDLTLMPGFIDIQINGSHGCDYSSEAQGDMIMHSRLELLKHGCTSHCPTLVSLSKVRRRRVAELQSCMCSLSLIQVLTLSSAPRSLSTTAYCRS